MMIYVQKTELNILFTQYEEETITKFDTFREIKPPNCICNLKQKMKWVREKIILEKRKEIRIK